MACDSVKFASCVLALPTCESCVADAYAGSAPSGKSPILSGDLCTRRASGTPGRNKPQSSQERTLAPAPGLDTKSQHRRDDGATDSNRAADESHRQRSSSDKPTICQNHGRVHEACGERQRNHAQVNCKDSVIGIDSSK